MLRFAENEEISTANSRVSRDEVTNRTRYGARRATLRRADWRHARSDRLACSPTDRPAGCIVCIAASPGSPGARRFVSFAPEGPRSSLDTRVCSPTKVRSRFVFLSLLARLSFPRIFRRRLLLAIRGPTRRDPRAVTDVSRDLLAGTSRGRWGS